MSSEQPIESERKNLTPTTPIKCGDSEPSLNQLVDRNRERSGVLADFLIYLGESGHLPLDETVTHLWRLAEECNNDLRALQAALK
ncbi:hypothetical protein [uncultured Pseudodesulfovibrio sp.]|uniref:hypothetical protein n=1 Tax=uncultured Pseudodesulfovibrio sp. TaxID=2035858 RepID=UPI0029C75268|nr:hypothetical protein [uncultured Pseudodesulfovibrio sp.]